MSRDDRRPRKLRKTTAPTVVRTHLAIITSPENHGQTISIHHELELVRASLLYADTIEVLSVANLMVREFTQFKADDDRSTWALLGSFRDETLRHLGLNADQFRQVLPVLTSADPEALRVMARLNPEMKDLEQFADLLEQTHESTQPQMAKVRQVAEQMRVESGIAELESVMNQGLVRFNDRVTIGRDLRAAITSFVDELKRYLQDPTKFVLLDEEVASLARSLIEEGHVQLPARSISNASEAALGTGFLARLPAFPSAPLDEIVDLRKDLDEPLGRYRRKVSHLRGNLQTGPFDEHIEAEIDSIWRNEIDPAIVEIRQAMVDHGLVRELLRSLSTNLGDFVKGVGLPAGLTVVSANMLDFNTALSTGLAGAAAVTPTLAKSLNNRHQGRAAARAHDLYYLYEANQKLGSA